MYRRIFRLAVALLAAAAAMVTVIPPAGADNASSLLGMVNDLRANRGIRPLVADPALTAAAQQWSAHMLAIGGLVHNANLGSQIPAGWTKLGENVGEGGNLTAIFNALVASPFHLANMVDTSYTLTGIGVAVGSNGAMWVTEDFEAGRAAPPTSVPAVTNPPTTVRPATTLPTAPRPIVVPPKAATALPTAPLTPTTTAPPVPDTTTPVPGANVTPPVSQNQRAQVAAEALPADGPKIRLAAAPRPSDRPLSPWILATGLLATLSVAGTAALFGRRLLRTAR